MAGGFFFCDVNSLPPFARKSANSTVPLPISISDILNGVDYVLITHLHPDHFDTKARETIQKSTLFITQPSDSEKIKEFGFNTVEVIDQQMSFGNVKISRVNAQHGEGKILNGMGAVLGYILEAENEAPFTLPEIRRNLLEEIKVLQGLVCMFFIIL